MMRPHAPPRAGPIVYYYSPALGGAGASASYALFLSQARSFFGLFRFEIAVKGHNQNPYKSYSKKLWL